MLFISFCRQLSALPVQPCQLTQLFPAYCSYTKVAPVPPSLMSEKLKLATLRWRFR